MNVLSQRTKSVFRLVGPLVKDLKFDIHTGVVKSYLTKKGFGFITKDEDGTDIFVHQSSLKMEGFRALQGIYFSIFYISVFLRMPVLKIR